ncbi:Pkinase-domain-containing protein [Rhizopus microsporus var. microsporus]|uniref:Pkinase-domain-containing protein n=1 Tax=Rhizopus microsporus var. microsporus TaxID=86635 RepID=A0A1X0REK0_RHIZD|nr:Pkinase-domain-containing protein [Rhizopus microsporus var. microsporus]
MLNSPRNSVAHNQQAKLAVDYNELLKELSSHEITSVGCYTIGETIGEGTFGKVKKGYHKLTGKVVAIKKISKQHAPMMAREIHHHKQIKHPNVVMLYEMITTESAIHIISEYCPNGDLLDALTLSGGRCSEARVHKWFHQLTDAINYCHMHHIVHRDLKLENILLDADDNVKICDFGFARYIQKNQYLETFCGSLSYSAPEVILRKKYTGPETDIWSLGVILYTLLAGEFPFDDDSEVVTQRKIVQVDYQMPYYFSSKLSSLINGMLQLEPSNRFSLDAIINHPWMTEIEDYMIDEGLTPSSSTTSNNSTSTDIDLIVESVPTSPQFIFSPQIKSSLGLTEKSPRFSAPTLNNNRYSSTSPSSFRTSLPSSFAQQKPQGMTPVEQRLFAALTAAGFDRDALIKMQTGECDTSSTLWHLLLENMTNKSQEEIDSVPNAFASAIENHQKKSNAVDCGIQTSPTISRSNSISQPAVRLDSFDIKPYPKPTAHHTIQTIGFGSTTQQQDKPGWFTSVKSWFGSKQQQQQQQQQQQAHRSIATSANNNNYTIPAVNTRDDDLIMSPPIYRTGSQKYRRRMLQLTEPPVSELDQLTYNGTVFTSKNTNSKTTTASITTTSSNSLREYTKQPSAHVVMPPTALTSARLVADTFSIISDDTAQPKEIDICAKRYSMMYLQQHQQPTPPPSPPAMAASPQKNSQVEYSIVPSPAISPIEEKALSLSPAPEKKIQDVSSQSPPPPPPPVLELKQDQFIKPKETSPSPPPILSTGISTTVSIENTPSSPFKARSSRFEYAPRSRLSIYGMQESRVLPITSKTIIEEEEEEEE